jgi:CRP-like cAMP-binding protein
LIPVLRIRNSFYEIRIFVPPASFAVRRAELEMTAMRVLGRLPAHALPLWLARQPAQIRDGLQAALSWRDVPPGEEIVPAFEADTGIAGVIDGMVALRLHREGAGGRLVDLRAGGYWFGRAGAVRATPDAMSVTTQRRTTVVALPPERVRELIAREAGYLSCFADLVSAHAHILTEQLDIAATRDADVRIARKIVACVGARSGAQLAATQWELAEMTNSSRNTVNRSLSALEKRGALRSGYGHIVVADGLRLAQIAGYGAATIPAAATGEKIAEQGCREVGREQEVPGRRTG